ncbi:MAG: SDR family NAD(P)-dependent oxidoreductase [Fodinibius sp.]|nr:SDR family NAD(P)-dependent oxidoreductase [Fodinibius sp.]
MNIDNKLCIVTGANSGIGKETVRAFAAQGAYVVMVCRNQQRAQKAKEELVADTGHAGIEVMLADLGVQHDIRELADQIINKFEKVDILVNNAGIIADEREETLDGIDENTGRKITWVHFC